MSKKRIWSVAGLVAAGVVVIAGVWSQMSHVEEPRFVSVQTEGAVEIRDYPELIAAQARVQGNRDVAISEGFRLIADYIFGNNSTSKKVEMTAPVTQQTSEKIAMTAPVTQQGAGNEWSIQFIMPASYTMETLPKPNNPAVELVKVEPKRLAVIKFSGVANETLLAGKTAELNAFVASKNLKALAAPTYAFYNPPWTLGMFRRNEIMVEVAK